MPDDRVYLCPNRRCGKYFVRVHKDRRGPHFCEECRAVLWKALGPGYGRHEEQSK